MQFSNLSRFWDLHVYWVDEDSALVPRKTILPGDKHLELTSEQHVWVLVASSNPAAEKRNHAAGLYDEGGILFQLDEKNSTKVNHDLSGDEALEDEEKIDFSPAVFVFRPASTSLVTGRCTSLIWIPWTSVSITQRAMIAETPKHKRRDDLQLRGVAKHRTNSNKSNNTNNISSNNNNNNNNNSIGEDSNESVSPHLHIQVIDTSLVAVQKRYSERMRSSLLTQQQP